MEEPCARFTAADAAARFILWCRWLAWLSCGLGRTQPAASSVGARDQWWSVTKGRAGAKLNLFKIYKKNYAQKFGRYFVPTRSNFQSSVLKKINF
jgi:hypothetical protein